MDLMYLGNRKDKISWVNWEHGDHRRRYREKGEEERRAYHFLFICIDLYGWLVTSFTLWSSGKLYLLALFSTHWFCFVLLFACVYSLWNSEHTGKSRRNLRQSAKYQCLDLQVLMSSCLSKKQTKKKPKQQQQKAKSKRQEATKAFNQIKMI